MAEVSMADLYAQALAAAGTGGGTNEVLPSGQYHVRLVAKKMGVSQGAKKPQYGLRWEVLDGPYQGKFTWTNQTLTGADGSNMQAFGIYLAQLIQLGVDEGFVRSGQVTPDQLPNYVVKGIEGNANFGVHTFGTDPATGGAKNHQDFKGFQLLVLPASTISASGTPNIPTQAPPAVQSVPVPQIPAQPVYVPQAAAIQAPVYVPTPQPVVVVPPLPAQPVIAVPQAAGIPVAPTGTQVRF